MQLGPEVIGHQQGFHDFPSCTISKDLKLNNKDDPFFLFHKNVSFTI